MADSKSCRYSGLQEAAGLQKAADVLRAYLPVAVLETRMTPTESDKLTRMLRYADLKECNALVGEIFTNYACFFLSVCRDGLWEKLPEEAKKAVKIVIQRELDDYGADYEEDSILGAAVRKTGIPRFWHY